MVRISLILLTMLFVPLHAQASDWTKEQQAVLSAIEVLSNATATNGAGAGAYGAVLADEFSRWTVGSNLINHKAEWVEGVRGWFDDGWRVQERQSTVLEINIRGDYAFTRRNVSETYRGPDGDTTVSSAALAEVWVRSDDDWRLLVVNVHPES